MCIRDSSMPIGHWTRTIFGIVQISLRIFFIRRRICSWFFHARTLLSCCLDPLAFKYDSRMVFTRIASPKVPFLTSSEADRAFQAVRNFDVELALFYSYHLDRFGYSVAASPANQQDASSVTIGLTPYYGLIWPYASPFQIRMGFRLFVKPLLYFPWCLPLSFL